MPELPEVETVRLGLQEFLPGQALLSINTDWANSLPIADELIENYLLNAKVESVKRRGKLIIMPLASKYSLLIHLKMTGQLVYRPNSGKGFGGGESRCGGQGREVGEGCPSRTRRSPVSRSGEIKRPSAAPLTSFAATEWRRSTCSDRPCCY